MPVENLEILVSSLLRYYSKEQLEERHKQAIAEMLSGVTVVSLSFDGGSSSSVVSMKPSELVTLLEECLDALDNDKKLKHRSLFRRADMSYEG